MMNNLLIIVVITVIVYWKFGWVQAKEVNAVCSWGEPYTNHIDPFTCFIRIPFQLDENDTLNFASEINETEILELNFWLPPKSRYQWEINFVPHEIFAKFSNLKSFSLPGRVQSVRKDDFQNATNLIQLSIGNQLKVIPSHAFSPLNKLEVLDLSWNKIKTIQSNGLSGLNNLRTLKLSRNQLHKLTSGIFNETKTLEILLLNNNQIEAIEDGTFNIPQLKHLDLSYNKLTQLSNYLFDGCIELEYLDLKSNRLSEIRYSLHRLYRLQSLNMDNNRMADINLRRITELPHLESLSIENNRRAVNDNIFVDDAPPMFTGIKSVLKNLFLSGNGLKNREILVRFWALGLTQLEKLHIDDNAFEFIDFYPIQAFPKLQEINLGRNYWKCDWLEQTVERLEADGIEVNLFSSHFPSSSSVKHVNFIQCV